jgi:hypothetical protein
MGQAIPGQHPAVVLRSHYRQLRALLAVAMIAVVGLTAAVVILANDEVTRTSATTPIESINSGDLNPGTGLTDSPATRYDGGPEEGTRGLGLGGALGARYDGGPEEGTRGALTAPSPPSTRYDGGPEEGSRGHGH